MRCHLHTILVTRQSGGRESLEQRKSPVSRSKEGLTTTPPQNRSTRGAHPRVPLLPGHSGGPCCGRTCPHRLQAHGPMCTHVSQATARTHGLPCGRRVHGRARLSGVGVGSNNAPRGLICPCWANEVGRAGPPPPPPHPFVYPFPTSSCPLPHSYSFVSVLCFPPWPNPQGFFGH